MTEKPKRVKKYKDKIRVLDNSALQGVCSCGWVGNALAQTSGLAKAMTEVQKEIQGHKHIPAPKKERKNAKATTATTTNAFVGTST
jgi:hypothetical protein